MRRLRYVNRESLAGLLLVVVGAFGLWAGRSLHAGSADAMGEGYVPRLMCWLLVLLGAIVAAGGLRADAPRVEPLRLRPLLAISGAALAFALALEPLGVVAAVCAAVLCATKAVPGLPLRAALGPAALLVLVVLAIFVWGLGLPIRPWPRPFAG